MIGRATAKRVLRAIGEDQQGATIIEFALVAPVLLLMLVGTADLGLQIYARAIVDGAMQEAGRNSSLEPGTATAEELDTLVTTEIHKLLPSATITFTRRNYENYADVGTAETYTDTNGDGVCNDDEPFDDMNGNGVWDADMGRTGRGGAKDAVLYTSRTSYTRLFPIHGFVSGISENVEIESTTVLRNQPYSDQGERIAETGYCEA